MQVIEKDMSTFERRMIALTVIGIGIAAITGIFFYVQMVEMASQTQILASQSESANAGALIDEMNTRKQLGLAQQQAVAAQQQAQAAQDGVEAIKRQMRQDQRPWIKIEIAGEPKTSETVSSTVVVGGPLTVPIRLINTGKTPAKHIEATILVAVVPNNEEPKLIQTVIQVKRSDKRILSRFQEKKNLIPGDNFVAGRIYSGNSTTRTVTRMEIVNGKIVPKVLSVSEANDLFRGNSYLVIDGQVHYTDGFGVKHWTQFCTSFIPSNGKTVDSAKCTNYAADDTN